MLKKYKVTVNGQSYDVAVEEIGSAGSQVASSPVQANAAVSAGSTAPAPSVASAPSASGAGTVKAPMPGTVLAIKVASGQAVKRGDVLLILEAMKMENEITATRDGTVSAIRVQAGAIVNTGDPLVDLS